MRLTRSGIKYYRGLLYSQLPTRIQEFGDYFRNDEIRLIRKPIIAGRQEVQPKDDPTECHCGFHRNRSENYSIPQLNLVFLWSALEGIRGSTLARVFQSADRVASCLTGVQVSICPVQSRDMKKLRGAIIVLHKNSGLSASALRELRRRSNLILVDYVDGDHNPYVDEEVDGFICASATEYEWIQGRLTGQQKCYLVPHAPDDRLVRLVTSFGDTEFRCGYFGAQENCLFATELSSLGLVNVVETPVALGTTEFLNQKWIEILCQTHFQFIARPSAQVWSGRFKPFNKGFQSAAINQLIIGARFDSENRYWLGDDYPFFVEQENLNSAIAAVDFARQSWSRGELGAAHAILERLRMVACPVQNALDYRDAFVDISR